MRAGPAEHAALGPNTSPKRATSQERHPHPVRHLKPQVGGPPACQVGALLSCSVRAGCRRLRLQARPGVSQSPCASHPKPSPKAPVLCWPITKCAACFQFTCSLCLSFAAAVDCPVAPPPCCRGGLVPHQTALLWTMQSAVSPYPVPPWPAQVGPTGPRGRFLWNAGTAGCMVSVLSCTPLRAESS